MARDTFVFDLDGTLSNHLHRVELAKAGEWDEFHSKSDEDELHEEMGILFRTLSLGVIAGSLIIMTGRNERYRTMTQRWLLKHRIYPDNLIMRGNEDYRKDGEMKLQMLDEHFGDRETALARVVMIFEDRDQVVEALRNAGFVCAQVRNGTY